MKVYRQRNLWKIVQLFTFIMFSAGLLSACGSGDNNSSAGLGLGASTEALAQQVVQDYSDIVLFNYQDTLETAQELRTAISEFTSNPNSAGLQNAKIKWLEAREVYGQTEVFRFYEGPIDQDGGPEGYLNAWPLDEAYIDYVEDNENAGFINDPGVDLGLKELMDLNEQGGEANVATGYHAIEFMLWGQDLNENPGEAGQRPVNDFLDAPHAERRIQYLNLTSELLTMHLNDLVDAWQDDDSANYRKKFLEVDTREALRRIIKGTGSLALGELATERMRVGLNTKGQEEEQSCFSDNTHRDISQNLQGIENVFYGSYQKINGELFQGVGLFKLFAQVNPEAALEMEELLKLARAKVDGIGTVVEQGVHYDEQIAKADGHPYRLNIREASDALENFTDLLAQVSQSDLDIDLNIEQN